MGDEPWRPGGIGRLEHFVARPGIVVPAAIGLEIHRRQLPDLSAVIDARFETARLFLRTHFQPVLQEDHAGVDNRLLDGGRGLEEPTRLFFGAETHDTLDTSAIVPAAVEDHDLARCRQVRDVALYVHLRLFALAGGGQGNHAEYAWTDPLGDGLDRSALAGAVPSFEQDAD